MKTHIIIPLIAVLVATGCSTQEQQPTQADVLTSTEATVASRRAVPESSILAPVHEDTGVPLVNPDSLLSEVVPSAASLESSLPVEEPVLEEPVVEEPIEVATFKLRHGETLHYFAKWSGLPVEVIAESSGLDLGGDYAVGTEVAIPSAGIDVAALEAAREQHWTQRIEGYLASRGGALGSDFHTVATGETAWSISRSANGIPVWVLASYNPDVALDNLHPGEKLLVPVLADIVVDADE